MPARRDKREMESKESERRASPAPQQATSQPSVTSRRGQYLIASRPAPLAGSGESIDLNTVREALERDPEITITRTLTPTGFGPLAPRLPGRRSIIVAEMSRERAEQMSRLPQLMVEPDHPLVLGDSMAPFLCDPGVLMPHSAGPTVTIRVTGKDEAPVEGASVFLFGNTWPAQAVTDANGEAQVMLFGESVAAGRGLYVKPRAGYWSRWVPEPELDASHPNLVALTPLDQTFPDFPDQEVMGWGLRAMRVDQLPTNYRGHGVRVAVVDTGLTAGHQDLRESFGVATISSDKTCRRGTGTRSATAPTAPESSRGSTTAKASEASRRTPRCSRSKSSRAADSAT
jgi:subtilisin